MVSQVSQTYWPDDSAGVEDIDRTRTSTARQTMTSAEEVE